MEYIRPGSIDQPHQPQDRPRIGIAFGPEIDRTHAHLVQGGGPIAVPLEICDGERDSAIPQPAAELDEVRFRPALVQGGNDVKDVHDICVWLRAWPDREARGICNAVWQPCRPDRHTLDSCNASSGHFLPFGVDFHALL